MLRLRHESKRRYIYCAAAVPPDHSITVFKAVHRQWRVVSQVLRWLEPPLCSVQVTKVCVNALVGNTFHGRVHYLKTGPGAAEAEEVVVDSRPSDAINLAVRFGAPLYVNKVRSPLVSPGLIGCYLSLPCSPGAVPPLLCLPGSGGQNRGYDG